ncbi:MAG: hypothetical protein NWF13_00510 [Candidatus Bathyarchaeota archaeon]|nr:hypothetical protein [Candidatus Bathyarchaeota archaeon]
MIQSTCRKKARRGISTVLGVLLMVGILFTTIIPLFIYVNSVNNHYDTTVVNMGIADQERSMEDLTVYAFGRDETCDINVLLVNEGSIAVNITRIWVMSMDLQRTNIFTSENVSAALNAHDLPLQLNPSDKATVENLTLTIIVEDPDKDVFNVEVTTARGNVFASSTNPISYQGGEWGTGTNWPWLEVIVRSDEGQDDFQVDVVGNSNNFTDTIHSEHVLGDYFTILPVLKVGTFNVSVTRVTQKSNPVVLYSEHGYATEELVLTEMYPIAMVIFIDPD